MARDPDATAVYECADLFRQRCLIEGQSLLWPERQSWTVENLATFDEAFLGHPDDGPGTFQQKWQRQLANVPDDVICIAADIMALYCLMPRSSSIGAKTKMALVQEVANWRPDTLIIGEAQHQLLLKAFTEGIAKVGTFYNTGRFGETEFLLTYFKKIVDEGIDPFNLAACKEAAHAVREKLGVRSQSSIIVLHLFFPDQIEGTTSHDHRAKIVKAFSHLVEPNPDQDEMILAIRNKLSNNGADKTFTFHRQDIQAQWDPAFESAQIAGEHRIVKIAPGHGAQEWQDCLQGGYICVGWDKTGDLRKYVDKDAFLKEFREDYSLDYSGVKAKITEKANELWTLMELKPGDRVVANKGTSQVLGVGTVVDPGYRWMPERKEYRHTVAVEWDTSLAQEISPEPTWAMKTVKEVSRDLWALISGTPPIDPLPSNDDYVEPAFEEIEKRIAAIGLRIDSRTLRRYHLALKTRGFVVLSGLSGTGKTWLAVAYARAVGARHLVVPVAPNWTTNEDLLGYANPLNGVYHDTQFSRFLREASAAWTKSGAGARPYHLVLDEMNLARVEYYFAKFLSAMEVRARETFAEIELAPDELVTLTPNLVVIGTVNIDETTHGFADKVHDRAQLIELEAQRDDLERHLAGKPHAGAIMAVWDAVHRAGPFSFRVLDEIAAYLDAADALGVPWKEALDEQLLQKVLPKLRGGDPAVGEALQAFITLSDGRFPLSHARAVTMYAGYQLHGFASFFR